ncbi:DNA cytosine methyltransferase [Dechloromonas denitrificans]|uniref:DNA cytosine methyltransferase n=1 Tax=Dechloromonas denitrificans TaxID=281362 RepID=UPI001CF9113C|nr:DNA cytosine methyltransferase [Dechloromonas denitrificans]UCV02336.1 DNA cytosine methyltransferase [Dechloromonas denitrificans]
MTARDAFLKNPPDLREIRTFCLFGAIGAGAKGFQRGSARVGNLVAKPRCIGSVDVDAAANRDFKRLVGVEATTLDLFDRDQYIAFHGKEPPAGWREATPDDIRRAAGYEFPHIVFLSAPCKGFSGLLNETRSKTDKYQALNRLTLRGIWLMLEAFKDDLPSLIVFENVPRIATRGRHLLDQIVALLRAYGYAVNETTHDCGELGGLAQSRKRFLLVARHTEKVPPFLYEPPKKRLQAVGTVLDRMPLPGDPAGGPMHRIPNLQWKTWVRLAFVEAGSDWRSLNRLHVEDGYLRDFLIVPEYHHGYLGVQRWEDTSGTVQGRSTPSNGAFSIADPRAPAGALEYSQYGVMRMEDTAGAVINVKSPGQGTFSVADPRHPGPAKHSNEFRIVPYDRNAMAVTSAHGSGQCVADPRREGEGFGKYLVTPWESPSGAVISGSTTGQGAYAIADPRPNGIPSSGDHYQTGGHYGVQRWEDTSGAVASAACHDNGRWSVADHRQPAATDKLVTVIRALDGTWHRPFTTLELAALQSIIEPEEYLELDGLNDSDWRERIGNAVPPAAAEAIASTMYQTLLLAWSGETFLLSSQPIWVQPMAIALSVAQGGVA